MIRDSSIPRVDFDHKIFIFRSRFSYKEKRDVSRMLFTAAFNINILHNVIQPLFS